MELLIETYTASEAKVITESVNHGKDLFLNGNFMEAETRNRNGRIYRLHEIAKAVDSLNTTIKNHGFCAVEADHPTDRIQSLITETAGGIMEVYMQGNHAKGKIKIFDTPKGLIVKEICRQGYRPGLSSRGVGSVDGEGIVEGFSIQTVDIVITPSAESAMPNTVYESLEEFKHGNKTLSLAEMVKDDDKAQKFFEKEMIKFLDEMAKYKVAVKV